MAKKQDVALNWAQLGRAAALVETMYPNYRLFAQVSEFGDASVLRVALDLVWEFVAGHNQRIDFSKQLEKLELVTPEPSDFDTYGVWPALDACAALAMLMGVCAGHEDCELDSFSRLSRATIAAYLDIIDVDNDEQQPLNQQLAALLATLDEIFSGDANRKDQLQLAKSCARESGASNIGIE